jgi:1-acyl-sn-glycerol-3-phosphate acyltransferase
MSAFRDSLRSRVQYYVGLLARLVFGLRVTGSDRVPRKGGVIIACNHISELDPPILGCAIPRSVAFMAKVELFRTRFTDFWLRKLNAFPVNRSGIDTMALRTAIAKLRDGEAVVIFPEGTRSHDGRLLPVKAGIGLVALSSGAPVVPTFIWGTDRARGAISRTGDRFTVDFGRLIPFSRLREIRQAEGNRAVAENIISAIRQTGIDAGLYHE